MARYNQRQNTPKDQSDNGDRAHLVPKLRLGKLNLRFRRVQFIKTMTRDRALSEEGKAKLARRPHSPS